MEARRARRPAAPHVDGLTLPELRRTPRRSCAAQVTGGLGRRDLAAVRVQNARNHVFSSLTDALEATFPVVCRLVAAASGSPRTAHPRIRQGASSVRRSFRTSSPARRAPTSPIWRTSRGEWAMNVALHAEAAPISPAALAAVPPTRWAASSSGWTRGVGWPPLAVDAIWRTTSPASAEPRWTLEPAQCASRSAPGRRGDDAAPGVRRAGVDRNSPAARRSRRSLPW